MHYKNKQQLEANICLVGPSSCLLHENAQKTTTKQPCHCMMSGMVVVYALVLIFSSCMSFIISGGSHLFFFATWAFEFVLEDAFIISRIQYMMKTRDDLMKRLNR